MCGNFVSLPLVKWILEALRCQRKDIHYYETKGELCRRNSTIVLIGGQETGYFNLVNGGG